MTTIAKLETALALIGLGMSTALSGCVGEDGSTEDETAELASHSGVSGANCDPANASGAVPSMHRALLDMIAFAEGTKDRGKDGYNIAFNYNVFSSCDQHPRISSKFAGGSSDAAGRYQFLSTTWQGLGLPNFWPENQERGAMALVRRRGVSVPTDRPLNDAEFRDAMDKLSWEWASLPPSRYGQGGKSLDVLRAKYCEYAHCGDSGPVGSDGCTDQERENAAKFGCACVDHKGNGGFCEGHGCTAIEEQNCAAFGTACVDHQCNGGFAEGHGCTALEEKNCAAFGTACVDHQCNGGFAEGHGCTALEEKNCGAFGTACVDHQCNGGFAEGHGCTALEEKNCAAFGTACVDHQCSGGFAEGHGCTALEEKNCASVATQCVDHQCSGGLGSVGNGCTAREQTDCDAEGQDCRDHACVAR